MNKKICFAASSGGHYEQLMMLKPLMEKYESFVITEQTEYSAESKGEKTYYMRQVNRKEKFFLCTILINLFKSIIIYKGKTGSRDLYRCFSYDPYLLNNKNDGKKTDLY
ncbi:TPA: hypothetical protein ACV5OK_001885 [Enterococcus faecium]